MHDMENVRIGDRIKKIRLMRELTQKQLGDRVGLSDVRIRQYEMGIRRPKEDMLIKLAQALDVSVAAISDPDLTSYIQTMHTLFMMEDRFGAHPIKVDGEYLVSFLTGENLPGQCDSMLEYIKAWYNRYNQYQESIASAQKQEEEEKKKYDLWRYRYPMDDAEAASKGMRRRMKIDQLKEELAKLEEEEKNEREGKSR